MKTGCSDLDNLTEYPDNKISLIFGEGGSGKTTLCLLILISALKEKKKAVYIDAGNNFSLERFSQLSNNNKDLLDRIILLKIKNFNVQHETIKKFKDLEKFDLIIIDSLTTFYRRLYSREPELSRAMLNKQLNILNNLNRTTVIVTSEVYSDLKKNDHALSEDIFKKYTKLEIKLEKTPRKLIVNSLNNSFLFKINNEGIIKI